MNPRPRILPLTLFALLLAPAVATAEGEAKAELPLRQVVLFTSGVGYFQRDGTVKGDARLEMRFDAADINDLLKSVVLRDLDGGRVRSVTYGSRDPIAKALRSFPIDLTDAPTLAQILSQVRGERVVLSGGSEGIIVGIERRMVPGSGENRPAYETDFINLLNDTGLISVPLSQMQQIRFARPELDREFRQALATVALGHDTEKKPVAFEFTGEGERRVRVSYIASSPVWKTSYRLVLQEGQAPYLQGWAIVENTSDEDWSGIALTLVSGRPISFLMDLYEPLYVERPLVELELHKGLRPRRHEAEMEAMEEGGDGGPPASAPAPGAVRRGRAAEKGALKSKSAADESGGYRIDSAAQGGEVGELFQYRIESPVTLPRRQSALLPIVSADVEGAKISIYNEASHGKHPYNGLRLKNTTGLSLMQGPITVFDGGTYAGDALIDDLAAGGERLLSYALDLDLEVEPVGASAPEQIIAVRLYRGALIQTREQRREREYRVRHRGRKARRLLIEHPLAADWTLLERSAPAERTREAYRFALDIEPGKSAARKVVEQRRLDQSIALSSMRTDQIELYLKQRNLSEAVLQVLAQVVALKWETGALSAPTAALETKIKEIGTEQERIRQNLARLPENSPLHARYIQTMTEQEDELVALRAGLAENRDKLAAIQKRLDDLLAEVDLR